MSSETSYEYLDRSYSGSRIFQPLGDVLGLRIDQLNFILTQTIALLFAYGYRKIYTYDRFSYNMRLCGTLIPGICLAYFCYGRDLIHLLLLSVISYIGIRVTNPKNVHITALTIAILYLSKLHLVRMIYDYGGYILDISGPVMIGVQKISSLGFNMLDGTAREEEELTPEQKRYAVRKMPTFLEYFSYLLSFQTLMCGPLVYYNDYIDFINGSNFVRHADKSKSRPSPTIAVIRKLSTSVFFAFMVLKFCPMVPVERLAENDFKNNNNFVIYVVYLVISTSAARFKYFFAWILGETICNASGLGFDGYYEDGSQNWELASNVDIWKLETSLNFKILLDNWNKTTQSWLKRCAYDRTPAKIRTVATYVLSALWHGFYPGYYLCFLTGALVTMAAREGRRRIRPLFQSNFTSILIYDVVTFIFTRVYLAYTVAPFVLLSLESSFIFYRRVYFFGHILCLIALFIVPLILPATPPPSATHQKGKHDQQSKAGIKVMNGGDKTE